ncbi:MAG TPA: methyltransferase domain-containing protein [Pseudonocardiaceae bacterium]|nr:methyltransferase domain-containing protein [Pseudonocardiaceae bacterium]
MANHTHHHHQHHSAGEPDWADMIELLDLDGEVLHEYLADATGWVRQLADGQPRARIVDLGSGTGTGAIALAQRFDGADVIAVDGAAPLLARLRDKAVDLGLADRIHTVTADLDEGWPALDTVDVVWASNSMHHMADPDRVLADVLGTLRPGGLLVVAEMESFPRFLPDSVGDGLEARCHAAMAETAAHELPHLGDDWGSRVAKAGFTVEAQRTFTVDLTPPLPEATGRYARESFRRLRQGMADQLSAADQTRLDALIDGPDGVVGRDDLGVRTARTLWVARRP